MSARDSLAAAAHLPAVCVRSGFAQYSYKNWTQHFSCPVCGRVGKFNLNFLGIRLVVCDGAKFSKVRRDELGGAQ